MHYISINAIYFLKDIYTTHDLIIFYLHPSWNQNQVYEPL